MREYTHIQVYNYTYIHIRAYEHTHATKTYIYICVCIFNKERFTHDSIYIHTHIYTYTCIRMYMYICNHIQRIKMHSQQYFGSDCILQPCQYVKARKRQPQPGQYSSRARSLPHVGNGTSNKLVRPAMDECSWRWRMCLLWC